MEWSSLHWKPRLDLDLFQRCLFIILFSWMLACLSSYICFFSLGNSVFYEILTTVALAAAIMKSSLQYSAQGRAVLITGCDTGFGFMLAKHLHSCGFTVFAGCLLKSHNRGEGATILEAIGGHLHVLQLDVTKENEWLDAIEYIKANSPDGGLWGLVNNAGWATFGDVEWVPMATYRKIAEVNMFGLIRGVQLALPLLRKNKGRIVTITSGLSRMAVPTRSPYIFTKYAVMGFFDCLRYEMETFGVKVSMIEPGNYLAGTQLFNDEIIDRSAKSMWNYMSDEVRDAYGEKYFKARVDIMKSYNTTGMKDLTPVINSFTDGLLDAFPQKRYQPMNVYFKVRTFIATHLPEIFYDWIYVSYVKEK